MKKRGLLLLMSIVILCSLSILAACNRVKLHQPVNLTINHEKNLLEWLGDPSAGSFRLDINGKKYTSKTASYSVADLEPDEYVIRVKAISNDRYYGDSDWSEPIEFEIEPDYRFMFILINDRTAYQLSSASRSTGDVEVRDMHRGLPITSIGDSAFASSRVTSIKLGNNIKSIGSRAFYNAADFSELDIPDSVTNIGTYIFQGSRGLKNVKLPAGIKAIPEGMFMYCRSLEEITLPDTLVSIGKNAFSDCRSLKNIVIPDSVTNLEESAFQNCDVMTEVTIGSGVTTIARSAFNQCKKLATITIPKSVTFLGNYAISECTELTSIIFEDGGTEALKISDYAFLKNISMENIDLPARTQKLSKNAFNETPLWDNCVDDIVYVGTWAVGYKNTELQNTIEKITIKEGTLGIADYGFQSMEELKEVVLPSSLKRIGVMPFSNCKKLEKINLPEGLEVISEYAFYITGITQITIPSTVTTIGTSAFFSTPLWSNASDLVYAGNWLVGYKDKTIMNASIRNGTVGISTYALYAYDGLASINIPSTIKIIDIAAFYGCTMLVDIELPNSVTEIRDYAFYNCEALSSIIIGNQITKIGRFAFHKNTNLLSISLPSTIKSIGNSAFLGCSSLTSVSLPSGLTELGDYAFYKCINLGTVSIPSGVKRVGSNAFFKCSSLTSVNFADEVKEIGDYAFYNCENLANAKLPRELERVGDYAFYGCKKLMTVNIGDNAKTIGEKAFYNCIEVNSLTLGSNVETIGSYAFYNLSKVTALTIPVNLKLIGAYAFFKCEGIKSITLTADVKEINNNAFYGCNQLTIYTEHSERPVGWTLRWNSSNRPVVWGSVLSADKTYLESFTKTDTNPLNQNAPLGMSVPIREGYTFGGWTTVKGGTEFEYNIKEIRHVPVGATLYAIWIKN